MRETEEGISLYPRVVTKDFSGERCLTRFMVIPFDPSSHPPPFSALLSLLCAPRGGLLLTALPGALLSSFLLAQPMGGTGRRWKLGRRDIGGCFTIAVPLVASPPWFYLSLAPVAPPPLLAP